MGLWSDSGYVERLGASEGEVEWSMKERREGGYAKFESKNANK
jgi:hypothetical protein